MAIIRTDTINVAAGVTNRGEVKTTSYQVEVHDCSGLDNDHVFTGAVPGVSPGPGAGSSARQDARQPPGAVDYPQANHTPQGMGANN
jgi:hypothetical protein